MIPQLACTKNDPVNHIRACEITIVMKMHKSETDTAPQDEAMLLP